MTVPNLDAMTQDDLIKFADAWERPTRAAAELLIGDRRPGYTKLCGTIAGYARNKAAAMWCRERGDIIQAGNYETICDGIYSRLPRDLRW